MEGKDAGPGAAAQSSQSPATSGATMNAPLTVQTPSTAAATATSTSTASDVLQKPAGMRTGSPFTGSGTPTSVGNSKSQSALTMGLSSSAGHAQQHQAAALQALAQMSAVESAEEKSKPRGGAISNSNGGSLATNALSRPVVLHPPVMPRLAHTAKPSSEAQRGAPQAPISLGQPSAAAATALGAAGEPSTVWTSAFASAGGSAVTSHAMAGAPHHVSFGPGRAAGGFLAWPLEGSAGSAASNGKMPPHGPTKHSSDDAAPAAAMPSSELSAGASSCAQLSSHLMAQSSGGSSSSSQPVGARLAGATQAAGPGSSLRHQISGGTRTHLQHQSVSNLCDEIQPISEEEERQSRHKEAALSRPMSIPSSVSGEGGTRTYRVVISPQPSAPGNASSLVTVDRYHTHQGYTDCNPGGGAGGGATAASACVGPVGGTAPSLSTSHKAGSFLGSLFNLGGGGGGSSQKPPTPDNSVHGATLLPHHYRHSPTADTFLSTSPLDAGSVLARASGSLKRFGSSCKNNGAWDAHKDGSSHQAGAAQGGGGAQQHQGADQGMGSTEGGGQQQRRRRSLCGNTSVRAFASVDNLSALVMGTWAKPLPGLAAAAGDSSMPGSAGSSMRGGNAAAGAGELRYPHMREWLNNRNQQQQQQQQQDQEQDGSVMPGAATSPPPSSQLSPASASPWQPAAHLGAVQEAHTWATPSSNSNSNNNNNSNRRTAVLPHSASMPHHHHHQQQQQQQQHGVYMYTQPQPLARSSTPAAPMHRYSYHYPAYAHSHSPHAAAASPAFAPYPSPPQAYGHHYGAFPVSSSYHHAGGGGYLSAAAMGPLHPHLVYTSASLPRTTSLMAWLQREGAAAADPAMCAADIAVLSSSLPANFGQPAASTLRRVDSITGSPQALSRVASTAGGSEGGGGLGLWGGTAGTHVMGVGGGVLGSPQAPGLLSRESSHLPPALPICLICLEMLTPQDFATGEAIQLECLCKGEVAMRHRACAIEWSNVKGNLTCDICKHPIANLPEIDPAIVAAREEARRRRQPMFAIHPDPTTADYVFDAIRVAWITIICCILFVDGLSVSRTFLIGASVGIAYCLLSLLLQHLYKRWRDAWRAAALVRQQQQQQHQQVQAVDGGPSPSLVNTSMGRLSGGDARGDAAAGPRTGFMPVSAALYVPGASTMDIAGRGAAVVSTDSLLTPLLIPGEAEADSLV